MLKFERIAINKTMNCLLWGTENPSPVDKSIGRQYKNKKLKREIDKLIDKFKGE